MAHEINNSLIKAIAESSITDLQALIDNPKCEFNVPLPCLEGATAFQHAISSCDPIGEAEMVRMLLASGRVNVNAKDKDGRTALHYAAKAQCVAATKMLIDCPHCELNVASFGLLPIHVAALVSGDRSPSVLSLLLGADRCDVNAVTAPNNETILHLIVIACKPKALAALLLCDRFKGWDVKNLMGQTALHVAVEYCDQEQLIVNVLIQSGKCDLALVDGSKDTLLHLAIKGRKSDAFKTLLASSEAPSIVNARNEAGLTPLHSAINMNSLSSSVKSEIRYEMSKMLIDCPCCDVNARVDRDDRTPLHTAVVRNAVEVARLLINSPRCRVDALDEDGNSALHLASSTINISFDKASSTRQECNKMLRMLLGLGVFKLNQTNRFSQTPLICYTRRRQLSSAESVQLFLDHGADVNATDNQGCTALFYAATGEVFPNRHVAEAAIRVLLEAGADPTTRCCWQAVQKRNKFPTVCQLLVAEGTPSDPYHYRKEQVPFEGLLSYNDHLAAAEEKKKPKRCTLM